MNDGKELDIALSAERFDSGERMSIDTVSPGQWYWVKETASWDNGDRKKGDEWEWFGCVMNVGSNYVELNSPHSPRSYRTTRIHFDKFDTTLRFEPNPDAVIERERQRVQQDINFITGEIGALTKRLGVAPRMGIEDKFQEGTNALVAVSGQPDVQAHKLALIEAKETTLPQLMKSLKEAHEELSTWLAAPVTAMKAITGQWKSAEGQIVDRIHTLELYAGLTEEAVLVREGEPALITEKLRVMQRRFYMDEECLAGYRAGGIEIRDIEQFDAWLSEPENMSRIFPFERCAIAFRVRRTDKERDSVTLSDIFVNINLRQADKTTFLYIRNGEQIWRVDCEFDFGDKLVPDVTEFDPSQPMMVKMFSARVDEIIPKSAWEAMKERSDEVKRKNKLLDEQYVGPHPKHMYHEYDPDYEWRSYKPFDQTNVHYDEIVEEIGRRIKDYNRVAVIIQGLFDRSTVLFPHNGVKVWEPESFSASIELIYDSMTLTHGEKPDFEAYRAKLNASLDENSYVAGQEDYWLRMEAEKENKRQQADYRTQMPVRYTQYRPHGNPGPGIVTTMTEWKPRAGKAVFRWDRARSRDRYMGPVAATLTVPVEELLNVSAYTPGDFKQFYADPRTRREYLKWAPLLLAAEDYHAGKMRPGARSVIDY